MSDYKAKELFIDTNVLLKVFLKEKDFESVLRLILSIQEKRVAGYISTVTLSEIVTIFSRKKQYDNLEEVLSLIQKIFSVIQVTSEIAILAGHLKAKYASVKSPLSFADSIIAASSLIYDVPIFTYDDEFDKIKEITRFSL